jgi:hypothetical protein
MDVAKLAKRLHAATDLSPAAARQSLDSCTPEQLGQLESCKSSRELRQAYDSIQARRADAAAPSSPPADTPEPVEAADQPSSVEPTVGGPRRQKR